MTCTERMLPVVSILYFRCQRKDYLVSPRAVTVSTEKLQAALLRNAEYYNWDNIKARTENPSTWLCTQLSCGALNCSMPHFPSSFHLLLTFATSENNIMKQECHKDVFEVLNIISREWTQSDQIKGKKILIVLSRNSTDLVRRNEGNYGMCSPSGHGGIFCTL